MIRIMYVFLLIFSSLIAQAQEKRGLNPLDVAMIRQAASATLSDDASQIAYTIRVQADPLVENKPSRLELHLYDVARDVSSPFVTRGNVRQVSFRPGHNAITFLNRLDGDKVTGLYQIGLHGGEASLLFSYETSMLNYSWSPDGKSLAFVAAQPVVKEKSKLPYSPVRYEQDLTYNQIYIADLEKGETRTLVLDGHMLNATWSPDGTRLLCMGTPTPLVDDDLMARWLSIVEVSSGNVVGVVEHQGKHGGVAWSPDGRQIAFIAGQDINDPIDGCLFVASATGGKPTQLNKGWEGKFEQIEWIESGQIHFLGSQGVESVYGTIKPDAKAKPQMKPVKEGFNILSFDVAPGGNVAFIADTYLHPSELFYAANGMPEGKRLTNSNPWLDEIKLAKQEVVRYKAKDGLMIEGMLIRPVDEVPGKKYPLILVVHGGPESHYNNGWLTGYSNAGHTAAAEGYAVFYPNYRGSTGRGVAFQLTSQSDAGGKEFDDLVDGVDYLVSTGLVDANKVGVTGGSYGGYATGWLSTRYTERFAAGVMFVGISNKVSKWGTTDIPNEEYLVHARKWVFDDYDFFLKRSPIYYADQCKTPLLIMHGQNDTRVHPSQSMELYRHVKSRTNTPVELVFYPGEGHGNANSTARYDYNLRMMQWFDKYLKGMDKS